MKKIVFPVLAILSIGSLLSCMVSPADSASSDATSPVSSSASDSSVSSSSASSKTSSSSSSRTSSSSSSSKPSQPSIKSITIADENEYHVGDTFDPYKVKIIAKYSDGSKAELSGHTAKVSDEYMSGPEGRQHSPGEPFTRPGNYSFTLWVKSGKDAFSESMTIDVKSGFDSEGYVLESVSYVGGAGFSLGHIVADELWKAEMLLHWNKGDEYYTYVRASDDKGFAFSLKKQGDDSTDYMNIPLEQGSTYDLTLSYKGENYVTSFTVYGNYYKLDSNSLTFTARDLDKKNAISKGDVKVLVIPITLQGNYVDSWTDAGLSSLDDIYFGTAEGKVSLKSYYATASLGKADVSGIVAAPYVENDPEYTDADIMASEWNEKLNQVLSRAVEHIRETRTDINFDDYDVDDDGHIDNAHFITNFNTKTYQKKTGTSPWGTPLWPHRSTINDDTGTKEKPVADSYSISSIDSMTDAITVIHEQGHVFGLDDYYDYSMIVDYVGGADMQSNNIFDWNSFSKLSVGWISPYVVTGETEITIGAASLNGDCIIVPADPATFNNSAYDEYFLIELFSPYGNNAIPYPSNGRYLGPTWEHWESWKNVELGNFGVRLYHVDARMHYWDPTNHVYIEATEADKDKWLYLPMSNDYYSGGEVEEALKPYADCKLLSVIQRSGADTFGDPYATQPWLSKSDLFQEGDVFTFAKYKKFLSKCGRSVTAMDNGENFPYKITFSSMSSNKATVKIELA